MADFEELGQLAGAYLNQDWDLDWASPEAAVAQFAEDQTEAGVRGLMAEVSRILDSAMSETEIDDL